MKLKINTSHDWELGDDDTAEQIHCSSCLESLDIDDPIINLFSRNKLERDLNFAERDVERIKKQLAELP